MRASIRVLVVDDDRTLREGCASVLQVKGYNVTASRTRRRGDRDSCAARTSTSCSCDLYMTPVSGMEILKAVLDVEPGDHRRHDDGQPERRVERRSASRWRVGLSAEAVLRYAPAAAVRPRRVRGARASASGSVAHRGAARRSTATATSSRCSACPPAFRARRRSRAQGRDDRMRR